jgi:hypothetical protein
MKTTIAAMALSCALQAGSLGAQSLTTESAVTAGVSTEDKISAAAVQLRAFGDVKGGVRFFTEAAWATRSDDDSDVFGAAYPYGNRVDVIEAYAERLFRPRNAVLSVRAGRYRTPFGISNGSDHAYSGFLRAPLIRYADYFALSNNFLEHGVDVVAGVPRLTLEVSVGRPADVGSDVRRSGVDSAVRIQSFVGPFIVGVSRLQTPPSMPGPSVYHLPDNSARGTSVFTGVDVRWMHEGVQLRGEWMRGRHFDDTTTDGWYADAIVHRPAMGRVTAVARIELLDSDADPLWIIHAPRQTIGARIRLFEGLSLQLNAVHQTGELSEYGSKALDVAVTYSLRHAFRQQ